MRVDSAFNSAVSENQRKQLVDSEGDSAGLGVRTEGAWGFSI